MAHIYISIRGTGFEQSKFFCGGRGAERPRKEEKNREKVRRTMTAIRARTKASVGRSYLSSKSIGGGRGSRDHLIELLMGGTEGS